MIYSGVELFHQALKYSEKIEPLKMRLSLIYRFLKPGHSLAVKSGHPCSTPVSEDTQTHL